MLHQSYIFIKVFPKREMKETKMKSYVVCPDCGTVFGVAEKIENMEIRCYKCRGKMIVNVNEKGLFVTRMQQVKTIENAKQIHITADIKL